MKIPVIFSCCFLGRATIGSHLVNLVGNWASSIQGNYLVNLLNRHRAAFWTAIWAAQ
jgi:hypothetical protein